MLVNNNIVSVNLPDKTQQENSDPDYNPDSDTEGKPRNIKSEDTKPDMNISVKNENSEGLDKKPGEKGSLTCNLCNKVFANKRNLREHHKIHTGEKEFSCPVCEKKFAQKGALTRHERTHTGLKPFQCSQCDYRCSDSSNLKNHEKRHTGERPFLCHQVWPLMHFLLEWKTLFFTVPVRWVRKGGQGGFNPS